MESKFFIATKLSDYVTAIDGMGTERAFLIKGTERALLIDGLTGIGSLKSFVRELTELPVSLALTHGHIDHAGAAYEYKECFMHPDDIALMYTPHHSCIQDRYDFVASANPHAAKQYMPSIEDVIPPCPVKTYPIYDGDVFDLGGVTIRAIHVPGHTSGSIVYLDPASRTIFSGDACNGNTLLCLDGSTTIQEYYQSLQYFKTWQPAFDVMYGGHDPRPIPNTIIDDALQLCEEIMARTDEKVPTAFCGDPAYLGLKRGDNGLPLRGGYADIMYKESMIFQREKLTIQGKPLTWRNQVLQNKELVVMQNS